LRGYRQVSVRAVTRAAADRQATPRCFSAVQ